MLFRFFVLNLFVFLPLTIWAADPWMAVCQLRASGEQGYSKILRIEVSKREKYCTGLSKYPLSWSICFTPGEDQVHVSSNIVVEDFLDWNGQPQRFSVVENFGSEHAFLMSENAQAFSATGVITPSDVQGKYLAQIVGAGPLPVGYPDVPLVSVNPIELQKDLADFRAKNKGQRRRRKSNFIRQRKNEIQAFVDLWKTVPWYNTLSVVCYASEPNTYSPPSLLELLNDSVDARASGPCFRNRTIYNGVDFR